MARCPMSPPLLLLLLPLLWAGVLCGDQQGPPPADLTGESRALDSPRPDSDIGRSVPSDVKPPVSVLTAWLTGIQVQLNSVTAQTAELTERQSQIESALEGFQSWLEAVQSRLEAVQSRLEEVQSEQRPVRDCSDLPAGAPSGVYLLQPGLRQPVPAFCDQETDGGGWTVIQRRADIKPRQDFLLGWEAYKWGFGDLEAEFWWGLENLFLTTSLLDRRYKIRFDLEDFDGERRYAVYQRFKVASEEGGYRLTALNYRGNAGDNFGRLHSGQKFSTKDRDQDTAPINCAAKHTGAWWYYYCHESNLNGVYLSGSHSRYADGVNWKDFRGFHYSLKSAEMKIKPSK